MLRDFKAGEAVNVNHRCYHSFRKQSGRSGLCPTVITLKNPHSVTREARWRIASGEQQSNAPVVHPGGGHHLKCLSTVCIWFISIQKLLPPELPCFWQNTVALQLPSPFLITCLNKHVITSQLLWLTPRHVAVNSRKNLFFLLVAHNFFFQLAQQRIHMCNF